MCASLICGRSSAATFSSFDNVSRTGVVAAVRTLSSASSSRASPGTDSDAQKLQVHPGRLENLFAADPSKEQTRRAAERAGASLRAERPSHRATVRSYSAIRTDLYARHETSFVFFALHAKVLRTVI